MAETYPSERVASPSVADVRLPTRDDFLLEPGLVFLNHGSFGATPRAVLDAQFELVRRMERNPVEWLGRSADALMAAARADAAGFLGAQPDDLVFFPNPTTAMNMVARSLGLGPGDEVLTTDHEYGAMDRTWRKLCGEVGASVVRAAVPLPVVSQEEVVEQVWRSVTPRTRVLFVSHLTSATALVLPVAELCRRARESGILAIVDGAHAPGHIDLHLDSLGCDVYTGALHKWLCAPKGCSFLWVRREVQERMQPLVISWGWESAAPSGSSLIDHHEWQGTRDLSPFLAVSAALEFRRSYDWSAVADRCHRLVLSARRRIDERTGLAAISPDSVDWIGQMAAVRLPQHTDVVALQRRVRERHGVEVPMHRWNDQPLVRVSCGAHTVEADIDALLVALEAEGVFG